MRYRKQEKTSGRQRGMGSKERHGESSPPTNPTTSSSSPDVEALANPTPQPPPTSGLGKPGLEIAFSNISFAYPSRPTPTTTQAPNR